MKKLVRHLFIFYKRYISRTLETQFGGGCRFSPTCSEYFIESVKKHGLLKGSLNGFKRVIRCHPFGSIGLDPVN